MQITVRMPENGNPSLVEIGGSIDIAGDQLLVDQRNYCPLLSCLAKYSLAAHRQMITYICPLKKQSDAEALSTDFSCCVWHIQLALTQPAQERAYSAFLSSIDRFPVNTKKNFIEMVINTAKVFNDYVHKFIPLLPLDHRLDQEKKINKQFTDQLNAIKKTYFQQQYDESKTESKIELQLVTMRQKPDSTKQLREVGTVLEAETRSRSPSIRSRHISDSSTEEPESKQVSYSKKRTLKESTV